VKIVLESFEFMLAKPPQLLLESSDAIVSRDQSDRAQECDLRQKRKPLSECKTPSLESQETKPGSSTYPSSSPGKELVGNWQVANNSRLRVDGDGSLVWQGSILKNACVPDGALYSMHSSATILCCDHI